MVRIIRLLMFGVGITSLFQFIFYLVLVLRTREHNKQNRSYLIFAILALVNAIYIISFYILMNSAENLPVLVISNRITIIFSMFVILLTFHFNKIFFNLPGIKDLLVLYILNGIFSIICIFDTPLFLANSFYKTSSYYTGLKFGILFQLWGIYVISMMMYTTFILLKHYFRYHKDKTAVNRSLFLIIIISVIWNIFGVIDALAGIEVIDVPPLTWVGSLFMLMGIQIVLVTKIQYLYHRIQHLYKEVIHDNSTKLFSKSYFEMELDKLIEDSKYNKQIYYVILVDVDDFKQVNDTYGHLSGDEVLRKLALIMKNNLRPLDVIARYGGDEFIMLIKQNLSMDILVKIIERLRLRISQEKFLHDGKSFSVTCSFGITSFEKSEFDFKSREEIIKKADNALYQSKKQGKNKVHLLRIE